MVGGITGSFFHAFDFAGRIFFTVLIGSERASRPKLRENRVAFGGIFAFGIPCAILFLINGESWFEHGYREPSLFSLAAMGFACGALLGFLTALIIINYVIAIEKQDAEEKRYRERYTRKYKELISSGTAADEADEQAKKFAVNEPEKGCFIATEVYGPQSIETKRFRQLRDQWLSGFVLGRLFISAYYAISPYLAAEIRRRPWLKRATKKLLNSVLLMVANFGLQVSKE